MSPFCGATDTVVWTFDDVSSRFQSQIGIGVSVTHSLGFTSGVTPADLFAASMAAKPSILHTCKALVGLETGSYNATTHDVRSDRPDALPTELSRLVGTDNNCGTWFI